jgi:cytosine/adenosine deaminase-related metal-dependent hydrolase
VTSFWPRPVSLVNARVVSNGGLHSSIRFASRVLSLGAPPERGDAIVDLDGAFVLPGLVNAHDHLELNHFGRLKFRDTYENASDWIDDMRPRLREDERIRDARERPLSDRLFAGGLKNLLSGVTTVCHHNPLYAELRRGFPIRVVRRYGWAHSFALEGHPVGARGEIGEDVARAYRKTRRNTPFFVHLAEGVDRRAREELSRLDALGCLGENTVLVHGVAIGAEEWPRIRERGAGLVWCPSSNQFLFRRTASVGAFLDGESSPIALGTDSRLTGSRDLLDELREARASAPIEPDELLSLVTTRAARLLRLSESGRLEPRFPADLTIVPPLAGEASNALLAAARSQLLLVAVGGRPLTGSPALSPLFAARGRRTVEGTLDGTPRLLERSLARRIRASSIAEAGLEVIDM